MRNRRRMFCLLWGALLLGSPSTASAACVVARPGEPPRAFLLTSYRGDAVETGSSHSALWLSGGELQNGVVINWGAYDSSSPLWWWHFVKGDLDFWMIDEPLHVVYRRARAHGRKVVAQRLDVPADTLSLLGAELLNLSQSESRHYRYDWFTANCATKARDAINRLSGGALEAATGGPADSTYREDILRHMAIYGAPWLGLHFMLSARADEPLSRWQAMTDPERLAVEAGRLQWTRADGRRGPLVTETCTMLKSDWPVTPGRAPDYTLALWAAGGAIGLSIFSIGKAGQRVVRLRWVAGLLIMLWGAFSGGLGVVSVLVWATTSNIGLGPTECWFQANPLTLGLVPVGLCYAMGRGPQRKLTILSQSLFFVGLLGLLLDPLPFFRQQNFDLIGLFLLPLLGITALHPWLPAGRYTPAPPLADRAI